MAKKKAVKKSTRPKFWTEAYLKKIVPMAVEGSGGIASVIAKRLGVSRDTIYAWQRKYPWILDARNSARETFIDMAENKLMKKVEEEEDWAIKFTLNSLGRARGYDSKPDVSITNNISNAKIEFEPPIDITPKKHELEDKTDK